jgi:hypothetical protein
MEFSEGQISNGLAIRTHAHNRIWPLLDHMLSVAILHSLCAHVKPWASCDVLSPTKCGAQQAISPLSRLLKGTTKVGASNSAFEL